MSPRSGVTLAATLLALLILAAVLGGLPWMLRAEARSAREDLASVRAAMAAEAALTLAGRHLEASPAESLVASLNRMPPPIHLPGAIGYAEFEPLDSNTVEVVAQGFSGEHGIALARRQLCALIAVRTESDSSGSWVSVGGVLPGAVSECGG